MTRSPAIAALLLVSALSSALHASEFDIVLHEIHYNPLSGDDRDEFIELYNRGPTTVDLGGWSFNEGITLKIPLGTLMEPKTFLVVSPDAAHAVSKYGLPRALGNYTGKLDNDGEIVTLANARGETVSRVHYRDEGNWPSRPDGLGPSLELIDPHAVPDVGRSWASSLTVGGTPGRSNSRAAGIAQATILVAAQDLWRYFKGAAEASNPRSAWTTAGYDDAAWATGPGGFGYGNQPFETELTDMQGSYSTLYMRAKFTLTEAQIAGVQSGDLTLTLTVRYDDAFVAYANGEDVGRQNASNAGTPPAFNSPADASGGGQAILSLDSFVGSLTAGQNALAIHGLNNTAASGDFLLEAGLTLASRPASTSDHPSDLSINEVKPTETGSPGFIELYNSSTFNRTLTSHAILDAAGHRFSLPDGTLLALSRATFTDAQLGFSITLGSGAYALVRRNGATGEDEFLAALDPRPAPAGSNGLSFGLVPDGGDDLYLMTSPSFGAANGVDLETDVVLNEVYFHPPHAAPAGGCARNCSDLRQWIEVHNRGAAAINVAGWGLSKAVVFAIPRAPALEIPAGGHLVFASSKATFLAEHPGFDPARVVGDWTRDLSHGSDTINLLDALGNRVDHVKYGDGGPLNDQEPADGADDRTFAGSAWPSTADGTGRTIELIHPRLDNRDGAAWAAGPLGGTPGAVNAAFTAVPAAVIGDVEHSPAVPLPSQAVTVKCRVSATQAIAGLEVLWHREGAAGSGTVDLKDDGLSGDGAAGDSVYAGTIPAQPDLAVVGFQVRARLADGKTTTVPRAPGVPPYPAFAGPFFLYQVLQAPPPVNPSESYYLVMAAADRAQLGSRPVESDELLPCTFVHVAKDGASTVRHLAGIRYRGTQTRNDARKSYRIDFASESRFEDIDHLDLNASGIERELLAADLFRRAGMPYPQEWTVNLTFQGTLDPRYVRKEHLDEDFLTRFFGDAGDSGNFYRALDPAGDPLDRAGDLEYFGEDPAAYVPYYDKRSNREENDYSDVVELCRAFDPAQTPDPVFPDLLEELIDSVQWARYFALQSLLSNSDGSIQTTSGEDYFLYRVPSTSGRPNAGKWILVPWDLEESFSNAGEPLFRPQLPAVRRFLTHPRFSPLYYEQLVRLRDGAFNRFEVRQRFVLFNFLFAFATIDGLDTYVTRRIGFVDFTVPIALSAGAGGAPTGQRLIQAGDTWRYWKGTSAPAGAPLAWTQRGYVDDPFSAGATGIGYGDGDDATLLSDMQDGYSTVYVRKTFVVGNPTLIRTLDLVIDYDDGFVAYLNGSEVARRNVTGEPGEPVPSDALANPNHEAGAAETINLNDYIHLLVAGSNVLAIQVINGTIDSGDLSLIPELVSGAAPSGGIGCGSVLYSTTDSISLEGRSNAYLTGSVKVAGLLASYNPFQATWSASVALSPGDNQVLVQAFQTPDGSGEAFESLTLTIQRLAAPAQVSGVLTGTTRWTAAGGPYLMTGNVTIPAGSRLLIDPGTLIIGQAGASIIVRGEIQASGTAAAPILFRALSCSNRWGGIGLDATGVAEENATHTLRYCDFEFGGLPPGFEGCIAPVSSKLLVDHCSFRFLSDNAVDGIDARLEVRDSFFEKIAEGVHCLRSVTFVLDSVFRDMVGDKDAIDFDDDGPVRSRIERCSISGSTDDGIDLTAATVDIRDNVIWDVADKAMSLEENGSLGPPSIVGNIVFNSGTAMSVKSGITITEAHHNTLVGNQEGVDLFAKAGAPDGGHAILHSMIVWNNIADVRLDGLSTVSFTSSDISSGVFSGAGNISSDPRFVNVAAGNFALRGDSPCIGTGQGGTDMGAVPFSSSLAFIRADSDSSGSVQIGDAIFTLNYLFREGQAPPCLDSADANDDGSADVSDPVFTLLHLFAGGRSPPPPYPAAGEDPTEDEIGCE